MFVPDRPRSRSDRETYVMKPRPPAGSGPADANREPAKWVTPAGRNLETPEREAFAARPTVPARLLEGSNELQAVMGHSESCNAFSRQGAVSSCDCSIRPLDDPAVVVGMVVHFVRFLGGRAPLPISIQELLIGQLRKGDAGCWVIADWLVETGIIAARILPPRRMEP